MSVVVCMDGFEHELVGVFTTEEKARAAFQEIYPDDDWEDIEDECLIYETEVK